MNRHLFTALFMLCMTNVSAQSTWQKQTAPIMTTWGEQLTPEDAWRQYPRPSMTRDKWMNLNGLWQYYKRTTIKYTYETKPSAFTKKILVPFSVESALSGIMDKNFSANKTSTHMYRRTFTLPEDFAGQNILLHFGAVDWRAYVYVNGQLAGTHDGGSDPFAFDITSLLKESGEQEVQVAVWDPTSAGGQPNGKQSNSPNGIWYTPNSGIWQTVWLEPVSPCHVVSYEPIPDIDKGQVSITVNASQSAEAILSIKDGGKTVATVTTAAGQPVVIPIPDAKLWSPDTPNLYTLDITLKEGGKEVDKVSGYFGMRKFSRGMTDGHPCVLLNNQPLYMYGPLDQGWWPDGLLTPPSYEAMIYDLQMTKAFGMNMVRKHIKVENDLWFDWCDRNGLVVWQDMPSGCGSGSAGTLEENKLNFYRENDAIINATRHHPCIGAWVVYNEGWGQHASSGMAHTRMGVGRVIAANHDPGRFVHAVTGWTDVEMGDFIDVHSYPAPGASSNPMNERVVSCGEFGGINLFVDGHMWAGSDVNYTTVDDADTYTTLFDHYTDRLQDLQKNKALWMSVYTQITDVEEECNGLMTYDRKVLKVNEQQMAGMKAKIERTVSSRFNGYTTIVPAGDENSSITWKYTNAQPSDDWYTTDYAASGWKSGLSGFGGGGRTSWTSSDIWLRRSFTVTGVVQEDLHDLRLWMYHDEDAEVYINGVLACKVTGYNNNYESFPITADGLKALHTDGTPNVMAVHCMQTIGGQYIDCGIRKRNYTPNSGLEVTPMPAVTPKPQFTTKDKQAYLMTYTLPSSAQLHYAFSYDGRTWKTLNGNRPVMPDAGTDIKSPFIRSVTVNGKTTYHLIADFADDTQYGLMHWQSADLINWETVGSSHIVKLSSATSALTESPEFIYDESSATYYIYWNANVNSKNSFYYATTSDWSRFSTPRVYFDPGFSAQDLHIERMGDVCHAYFYSSSKGLCTAKGKGLKPTTANRFTDVQPLYGSTTPKLRHPETFASMAEDGWYMFTRTANDDNMRFCGTGQPEENKWYPYDEYEMDLPEGAEVGSVIIVSTETLEGLLDKYGYEQYMLLPTAETEPQTWLYQALTSKVATTTWTTPTYRDIRWKEGKAGFGGSNPPGSYVGTAWTTSYIQLRYHLDLTGLTIEQIQSITGRIHHDENVTVYFNGVEAFKEGDYLTAYKDITFTQEALDALTPDAGNVIAVECYNGGGGQYVDLGLKAIRPMDVTSIGKVSRTGSSYTRASGIYNLLGQEQASPQKGINIINGNKIIVR